MIREAFDANNAVAGALSVYGALCEIASDEGRETFRTLHSYVGQKSGVSVATVRRVLGVLESIGLVEIVRPQANTTCSYTLLSCAHDDAAPAHGDSASGHNDGARYHGSFRGERALVEVTKRTKKERRSNSRQKTVDDGFLAEQRQNFPHLNVDQELGKARAWIAVNPGRQLTQKFFVGWLNRAKGEDAPAPKEEW